MPSPKKKSLIEVAADVVGSALPGLGPLTASALIEVEREWSRAASVALRAAEVVAKMDRWELGEQIGRDPRLVPLYVKVVYAAGMNGHDDTLRAMGAALGTAARATREGHDDDLADAEDALSAMRELGPRHFVVMAHLRTAKPGVNDKGGETFEDFLPATITARTGLPPRVVKQCLLNLAMAGVVVELDALFFSGSAFQITDLGLAVMTAVETVYPT